MLIGVRIGAGRDETAKILPKRPRLSQELKNIYSRLKAAAPTGHRKRRNRRLLMHAFNNAKE